jgi:5-(carboxyamino)imidazole ribonucleotide mutase
VAIGNAKNAGLLAAQILSIEDTSLAAQLETYRKKIADDSRGKNQLIKEKLRKK